MGARLTLFATLLLAACDNTPRPASVLQRYGPDEHGIACYRLPGGSALSCAQVVKP